SETFGIWLFRTWSGYRNAVLQRAAHIMLDVVRNFLRAGLGKMHPVAAAQAPNLAFEIRALHCVLSMIIDETVPDVDISDPCLFRLLPIKLVEINDVANGARATDRR